ncbi:hypothetical protein L873DRAFT_1070469 [Choiromyces venosus 120613-1]|uniref:Uncharacterized protein n=1 Tax=Choiromyces venosus 120613-1 TaxID=1336337 RepID=A0A3N4K6Z4_9PEZI|nr:hypothetical protein L873DRAFT_1070469 [Choiromyces venosus 120613-1]
MFLSHLFPSLFSFSFSCFYYYIREDLFHYIILWFPSLSFSIHLFLLCIFCLFFPYFFFHGVTTVAVPLRFYSNSFLIVSSSFSFSIFPFPFPLYFSSPLFLFSFYSAFVLFPFILFSFSSFFSFLSFFFF